MSELKILLDEMNAAKVHDVHGTPVIVAPDAYDVHQLPELLRAPLFFQRRVITQTVESLIQYGKNYANTLGFASAVFHDVDRSRFTLVIDNDNPGMSGELEAAHGRHAAVYEPVRSAEFKQWLNLDGKWIGQQDLAEFFEDREDDFEQPTGAEIYQLVTNLQLKRNVTVASAIDQRDGTFAIQYAEEKGKGSIELPETLELGISPFKNGPRYSITAKLRYRLTDGKVAFQIKLRNADKVLEFAFEDIVQKIKTELPDVAHYTASAW
jgi:uncharacterized protein YfdQ (DUF2303 family)